MRKRNFVLWDGENSHQILTLCKLSHWERFGKNVCKLEIASNVLNFDQPFINVFMGEVKMDVKVFCLGMEDKVFVEFDSTNIVTEYFCKFIVNETKFL